MYLYLCQYIICFIIPNQDTTCYYKNLDDKTFLFTLNDKSYNNANLKNEYKPIYDFIIHNNLFKNIPTKNNNIQINKSSRLWLVDGHPCVRF